MTLLTMEASDTQKKLAFLAQRYQIEIQPRLLPNGVRLKPTSIGLVRLEVLVENPQSGRIMRVTCSRSRINDILEYCETSVSPSSMCRSHYYGGRCDHMDLVKQQYSLWFMSTDEAVSAQKIALEKKRQQEKELEAVRAYALACLAQEEKKAKKLEQRLIARKKRNIQRILSGPRIGARLIDEDHPVSAWDAELPLPRRGRQLSE